MRKRKKRINGIELWVMLILKLKMSGGGVRSWDWRRKERKEEKRKVGE